MTIPTTLAQRLSDFSRGLQFQSLPRPVVHEVKRRVLDSLGCAAGAWHSDPCAAARRIASRYSAERGATVWGTSHRAPVDWAAFANGCLVRYLDYNDTYLSLEPAHPSDNIPAAIAVAESCGASGQELITAIALAYEIQCRFCDAVSIRARGWDHVTYGTFSTAAAAAKLLRLSAQTTRDALGIAGIGGAHLRQSRAGELSHWKGCAFAAAARHGVFAAVLASEGVTGPAPIFEGVFGFDKLVAGQPMSPKGPFAEDTLANFDDFMILKTSIKYWPVEYHAQSAVEAALELHKDLDLSAVEKIEIESHDASVDIIGSGAERWRPTSRETADHSLPYIVGAALADGEMSHRQFSPRRFTDPKLLDLVAKITVLRNHELSAKYPGEVGNIITIHQKIGPALRKRVDVPLGNARKPLTDAQVREKFHVQADDLIGRERAAALAELVWRLDELASLDEIVSLFGVK